LKTPNGQSNNAMDSGKVTKRQTMVGKTLYRRQCNGQMKVTNRQTMVGKHYTEDNTMVR